MLNEQLILTEEERIELEILREEMIDDIILEIEKYEVIYGKTL